MWNVCRVNSLTTHQRYIDSEIIGNRISENIIISFLTPPPYDSSVASNNDQVFDKCMQLGGCNF